MNPSCMGSFINEAEGVGYDWLENGVRYGYHFWGRDWFKWREKQLFLFQLNEENPLTFIQENGDRLRPCLPGQSFPSDLGSIPLFMQRYIRINGPEYAYHDRIFEVGYIWVKYKVSDEWIALPVSLSDANTLLHTMSMCTKYPRGKGKAGIIWAGVTVGGPFCGYTKAKLPLPEPHKDKSGKPDVDDARADWNLVVTQENA